MSPYRQPDRIDRRRAVIAEACRVRDALAKTWVFYNVGDLRSSLEIIDALTGCLNELTLDDMLDDSTTEVVPF